MANVHIRSNSMPSTSHPSSQRVEEELYKLRAYLPHSGCTAQMLSNGLRGVAILYDLIEEVLHLPSSQLCQKKWVEEQLDCSLGLLDLIASARDSLAAVREYVRDLRSAIRRKGNGVSDSRKRTQKMIKNCLKSLKQIDSKRIPYSTVDNSYQWAKFLVDARDITISFLSSVLSFLSKPKTKASRWSIISKAISKRKVVCKMECEGETEGESVNLFLQASYDCILSRDADAMKVQKAHDDLQALEARLQGLELGLEFLFRQFIQNRVSLLNILSL